MEMLSLTMSPDTKLGISIEPAQVRLIPAVEDGYLWTAIPEKKHLFTKQLSKLSIGAYMELCREAGKSFEAVERPDATIRVLEGDVPVRYRLSGLILMVEANGPCRYQG
jgi:hypothetical protein